MLLLLMLLANASLNAASIRGGPITEEDRKLWSLQPIGDPSPPSVRDLTWPKTPIDHFILARLEANELRPVAPATKLTLIRRVTYDLTGLPPTRAEIDAFLADESSDAFEKVVERLLNSRAYGERWGRHWLDVVRYADTAGETGDYPVPQAYRYRNWVINAINDDMPYNQFIREQIAGDLIAQTKGESISPEAYERLITATGFIAISRRFGFDVENYHYLTIQDTIDTLGQSVLGLTLGCARCHDHKYDPVNMDDYYAWYGIFESTKYSFPGSEEKKRPYDMIPVIFKSRADALKKEYDAQLKQANDTVKRLTDEKSGLESQIKGGGAAIKPYTALTAMTSTDPVNWESFIRATALNERMVSVDGHQGFNVWRKPGGLPTWGVNIGEETLKVPGTVPPGGVVTHPAERNGAAVAWQSPAETSIRIEGRITDAHHCGDCVLWHVDRLGETMFQPLAKGSVDPKGFQELSATDTDGRLKSVTVAKGDFIQLVILPKEHYGCDLTQVEFRITEVDGEQRVWDLAKDIHPDIHEDGKGNPHSDAHGNDDTWYFFESPVDRGVSRTAKSEGALAKAKARLDAVAVELREATAHRDALKNNPPYETTYGALEGKPANAKMQKRGDPKAPGDAVERRNLAILGGDPLRAPDGASGRMDMAEWLTRDGNPLTARVMVNRIWQQHFGHGLVRTENDFGARGEPPTHPELLDWLASHFIRSGWSLKALHRLILASATYQLSVADDARAVEADAEVRLRWRFDRRRLSAEEFRDAMLVISGELDPDMGGAHPFPAVETWGFTQHNPYYGVYPTKKRSIYLMQQRLKRHPFLALFDGADPNVSTAKRMSTTTPTQALFLMNSPFVHEQSQAYAQRLREGSSDLNLTIRRAYMDVLNRPPQPDEMAAATKFIHGYRSQLEVAGAPSPETHDLQAMAAFARTLFVRNEFLFVD